MTNHCYLDAGACSDLLRKAPAIGSRTLVFLLYVRPYSDIMLTVVWPCKQFGPGEYDHAALAEQGAVNDDCESVVVEKGCYAVCPPELKLNIPP